MVIPKRSRSSALPPGRFLAIVDRDATIFSSRPIAYEVLFSKLGYSPEQAAALVERINAQRSLNASMN